MHCNLFRMGAHAGPCLPLKVPTMVTRSGSWSNRNWGPDMINHAFFYITCRLRCVLCLLGKPVEAMWCSVMFWAIFCWETLGPTIHLDVTLTRTTYLCRLCKPLSCKHYSLTAVASFSRILHAVTKQKWFDNEFKVLTWPINSPILHDKLIYGRPTPQLKWFAANILVKKPVHASMGQGCFDSKRGILGRWA